jgi:hypothetical protein
MEGVQMTVLYDKQEAQSIAYTFSVSSRYIQPSDMKAAIIPTVVDEPKAGPVVTHQADVVVFVLEMVDGVAGLERCVSTTGGADIGVDIDECDIAPVLAGAR